MKSLIKLAIIAAILYGIFVYAKPHLDRMTGQLGLGDLGGGGSESGRCVAVAERTTEAFSETLVQRAQPPISETRWAGAFKLAEGRLREARLACECQGESCDLAREALDMLESHMGQWDQAVRHGEPMLSGARNLERIYSLLGRAKGLAD